MSLPQKPGPAKLVIGIIMKDKRLLESLAKALFENFGPVDIISPWIVFDYTDYYASEMGVPLYRRVLVFRTLIKQSDLPGIKNQTNAFEKQFSGKNGRKVNIDPGYLLAERFVLATGKNFSHRIYIGESIYADLTLIYQKGAFRSLPWTYPDYADTKMTGFLEFVRKKFLTDLRSKF